MMPMTVARIKEERISPITLPTFIDPERMACIKAQVNTIHNTSLKADSSMRMVPPFSLIFNCLTSGITTADEVPPTMAPNIRLVKKLTLTINPKSATTIIVIKKLINVSFMVPRMEFSNVSKFSWVPLSKRMMTKVIVVNTLATEPRSDGFTKPKTGPMNNPMIISNSTSGMRFRLKISVKRCAAKMSRPIMAMVNPILEAASALACWMVSFISYSLMNFWVVEMLSLLMVMKYKPLAMLVKSSAVNPLALL